MQRGFYNAIGMNHGTAPMAHTVVHLCCHALSDVQHSDRALNQHKDMMDAFKEAYVEREWYQ